MFARSFRLPMNAMYRNDSGTMEKVMQKYFRFPLAFLCGVLALSVSGLFAQSEPGWVAFNPGEDPFTESAIDLRFLNEKIAGEHGFIAASDARFIHSSTGESVRFWGVNGPPQDAKTPEDLRKVARLLAKRGVNLVRVHTPVFKDDGEPDIAKVRRAHDIVDAMKAEGIYTHFSIYFPLWMRPKPGTPWLDGYDGGKHPFAALFFNREFQAKYRNWWTALLTTPNDRTRKTLVEDPAVMGLEMQNEDSFFFWTFTRDNVPDPQLRILEKQFGEWLKAKYGSIDAALTRWNAKKEPRDNVAEGRIGFRPLWNMSNERSARDQDTARFLFETQTAFYRETYAFLRSLGFKGVITASNWATASPEVFGPLEKLSYTVGDFVDRHGYFSTVLKGTNSAWSIREKHTYMDRSALRFDPTESGKSKVYVHPVMDPEYAGKPSMISETTFERPNRFRTEAVLLYAAYGALQDSDAIVHFAHDGSRWSVKPGFWMQPWTLMSPTQMGQFPAAALLYRRGLVATGDVLANVRLSTNELFALRGTPLAQDASFDEFRAQDIPELAVVKAGQPIDPLIHFAGRTTVRFDADSTRADLKKLKPLINRTAQTVTSSTSELKLDYGKGLLTINAPKAQGLCGALKQPREADLRDITISSELDLGTVLVVTLDDQPLATSTKILLQVMSEEKSSGRASNLLPGGRKELLNIGKDPWLIKELNGTVKFKRPDAATLKVTALDLNGYATDSAGAADEIRLKSGIVYYLISK